MTIHKRRSVIPGGIPTINYGNPLTVGLLACYVPSAHQGPKIHNLCHGGALTLGTGATYAQTPEGLGLQSTASDGGAAGAAPTRFLTAPYASLYWRGYHTGIATGSTALIGVSYSDTDTPPWEVFAIETRLGAQLSATSQVNTTSFEAATGTDAFFAWDRGSYAATFDNTNGLFQLFKNSDRLNITINGGGAGWAFINPRIELGVYAPDTTRISNAISLFACIWNRVLAPWEVTALDIDPYQFLIYPEDEIFALGVSAARQKAVSLDGVLALMNRTQTTSLDAFLMKTQTATSSLDSVLFKTAVKTATFGGILIRLSSASASLDARLTQNKPFVTMDAFLFKTMIKTGSMDAQLSGGSFLTATFTLSVQIPVATVASMDAMIYPAFFAGANRTAIIPDIVRTIDVEY